MPDGLDEDEQRVQRQRRDGREGELRGGELRPRRAPVVNVGSTRRHRGQRDHRGERGTGALGIEDREVVPQRPDEQRQADDAVAA